MSKLVIFGAGGKAGRAAVQEARSRGHEVTAVVRDPSKHPDIADPEGGVDVVTGDVLDSSAVASIAGGHDAAISTVYDPAAAPGEFFASAATSLLDGLPKAGVPRVLVVGVVSTLDVTAGMPMFEAPDFPDEYREFGRGHMAGLRAFRSSGSDLDWLVVTPPMVLDEGARTGTYRVGGDEGLSSEDGGHLSYADLAIALLDEIDTPEHHRTRISVAD